MKKIIILILVTLSFQKKYSQVQDEIFTSFDFNNHKRIYNIHLPGPPQYVDLIEFQNGKVEGKLITVIDFKKDGKKNEIIDTFLIDSNLVKVLILELYKNNIETLESCVLFDFPFDDNCGGCLDCDSTIFKITTQSINRKYSFEAIWPGADLNPPFHEKQKNAQILLNILDKEINFDKHFNEALKRLMDSEGEGEYSYFSMNSIILYKKNK